MYSQQQFVSRKSTQIIPKQQNREIENRWKFELKLIGFGWEIVIIKFKKRRLESFAKWRFNDYRLTRFSYKIYLYFKWKNLLCLVNFFPPKFLFSKYKRKIWRQEFTLQRNEVYYKSRGRNTVRDESFSPRLDKARDC